jgi:hypothetical protein
LFHFNRKAKQVEVVKDYSFFFGERIGLVDWNKKKQRAKNKALTTIDGEHSLNDLLDNLKTFAKIGIGLKRKMAFQSPTR